MKIIEPSALIAIPEITSTIFGVIIGFVLAEFSQFLRNKREEKKELKLKTQAFVIEYVDLVNDAYSLANYLIEQKKLYEKESSTSFWQFIKPLVGEAFKEKDMSTISKSVVLQTDNSQLLVKLNKLILMRNQFIEIVRQFFEARDKAATLFEKNAVKKVDFSKMQIQFDEQTINKIAESNPSIVMDAYNLSNLVIQQSIIFKDFSRDLTTLICSELRAATGIKDLTIELSA